MTDIACGMRVMTILAGWVTMASRASDVNTSSACNPSRFDEAAKRIKVKTGARIPSAFAGRS